MWAGLLASASQATGTVTPCGDRSPLRHALFGDLHIHTGLSADANIMGISNRPADAYRFARGGPIELRYGGAPPVSSRLARPLDFAAVTDHAEVIGAIWMCRTPDSEVYNSEECQYVRKPLPSDAAEVASQINRAYREMEKPEICGEDGERCREASAAPWREIQTAAASWNDPCDFTTFVAFEYSPTPGLAMVHRNVIFRNDVTVKRPISSADTHPISDLWEQLQRECTQAGTGCDVITIPHNMNMSNGRSFRLDYDGETDRAAQVRLAHLRSEMEPVAEISQIKGDSECRNGLWKVLGGVDELCGFEKWRDWQGARYEDCREGIGEGALTDQGCVSRLDHARTAVAAGLAEERRIGVNPHKVGFIGSTDAHNGSAGDVEEWAFDGIQRPAYPNDPARRAAGALAAVWAEENTREAIFQALERKESFATSGPRIQPRFFGGWNLPQDLCGQANWVARGYAEGVPMGSDLPPRGSEQAPSFVVSALADPGSSGHPGGLLQRVQIIKVWPGEGAILHQAVYDAAGGENGATVDPTTCQPQGPGATTLCSVWRDPDFDPALPVAYYARVIENPSCRHTAYRCNASPKDSRPADCDDPSIAMRIQERAWTSPIWYTPPDR